MCPYPVQGSGYDSEEGSDKGGGSSSKEGDEGCTDSEVESESDSEIIGTRRGGIHQCTQLEAVREQGGESVRGIHGAFSKQSETRRGD